MTAAAARKLPAVAWNQFQALEEGDLRELIDGELVEVEVPTKWHEQIVSLIVQYLGPWARAHGKGRVLTSGYKIRISDDRGVMPDVQLLSQDTYRRADPNGLVDGRPEMVIEVISPSSRRFDRATKLGWYASIGVPEYWLVDPEARTLERLVLRDGRYLIAQTAEGDTVFKAEDHEGLEIPLAELWAAMVP